MRLWGVFLGGGGGGGRNAAPSGRVIDCRRLEKRKAFMLKC